MDKRYKQAFFRKHIWLWNMKRQSYWLLNADLHWANISIDKSKKSDKASVEEVMDPLIKPPT